MNKFNLAFSSFNEDEKSVRNKLLQAFKNEEPENKEEFIKKMLEGERSSTLFVFSHYLINEKYDEIIKYYSVPGDWRGVNIEEDGQGIILRRLVCKLKHKSTSKIKKIAKIVIADLKNEFYVYLTHRGSERSGLGKEYQSDALIWLDKLKELAANVRNESLLLKIEQRMAAIRSGENRPNPKQLESFDVIKPIVAELEGDSINSTSEKKKKEFLKKIQTVVDYKEELFWMNWSDAHSGVEKHKQLALKALHYFKNVMQELGDEKEVQRLDEEIDLLEKEEKRKAKGKPDPRSIDETLFWEIIETSRKKSDSEAEQVEVLITELEKFKVSSIKQFQKILDEKLVQAYHHDIWALAHLAQDGCSDDSFEYFRAWLILQGKEVFDLALEDVNKVAKFVPAGLQTSNDQLVWAPSIAYEARAGKALVPGKIKCYDLKGEPWEEEDLAKRFPKLVHFYRE